MKDRAKKTVLKEPKRVRLTHKLKGLVVFTTLDRTAKQCSEVHTDGDETQKQKDFTIVFTAL